MKEKDPFREKFMPKKWIGCPVEEEYFGDERKSRKAERKIASAKDRSKYKKTDLRKEVKQKKEFFSEELERGRVLSIASQGISVDCKGEKISCTLRGVLKKEKTHLKNLVTVGDFVLFERDQAGQGLIVQVEPRTSVLSRADNLSRRKEQLIAANIDQVLITVSVISPPLKPSLIDRYIIASRKGGMEPVVIVNKVDLLQTPGIEEFIRKDEDATLNALVESYRVVGIPVIKVSVVTGEGIEALTDVMASKASVFSGQSGVGKSSLINLITGKSLRIGKIVDKTNKGTHTTTTAELLSLDFGGWCIDTPGIRSFGLWNLELEEIEQYFPEIFEMGRKCRYPDCSHFKEEECAVIQAVSKGEISPLRYDSYLSLMESIRSEHFRR